MSNLRAFIRIEREDGMVLIEQNFDIIHEWHWQIRQPDMPIIFQDGGKNWEFRKLDIVPEIKEHL